MVFQEFREDQESQEALGNQDWQVHQVKGVNLDNLVYLVWENLDWMVCQENQDCLVARGNLVHLASLEDQGYLVLENQDIQVLKVTKDMVVYLVNQVQKVIRVMVVLQG